LIVRRVVFAVAALAATAAASGVLVVAAAFALYQLLRQVLTPAEAGGVLALAAAIVCVIGALVFVAQMKLPNLKGVAARKSAATSETSSLPSRVVEFARERPFVAAGAAVAAGLLALANPSLVTAVMRGFVTRRTPRR
jgi:hypothetical protein